MLDFSIRWSLAILKLQETYAMPRLCSNATGMRAQQCTWSRWSELWGRCLWLHAKAAISQVAAEGIVESITTYNSLKSGCIRSIGWDEFWIAVFRDFYIDSCRNHAARSAILLDTLPVPAMGINWEACYLLVDMCWIFGPSAVICSSPDTGAIGRSCETTDPSHISKYDIHRQPRLRQIGSSSPICKD